MPEEIDIIADLILQIAVLQEEVAEIRKLLKEIEAEIKCLPSFEMMLLRE